jgi:RNA polymerase sigma-70 factor (ECF subfamily)
MNDRDANAFHTTRWTQVIAARGSSPQARQALAELCAAYYAPVAAFVQGYRSGRDDSRDLTHEFFARLLEGNSLGRVERTRGRFRSYLLGAVKHFLADQRDRMLAAKRGGGGTPLSLDAWHDNTGPRRREHAPIEVADPRGFPADAFFDHHWALTVVEQAMNALQGESQGDGDAQRFEILKRWLITPEDPAAATDAACSLHMTDGAFKVAVHRLRKRFRQIVRDKIAATVEDPEALHEELEYLIQALMISSSSMC